MLGKKEKQKKKYYTASTSLVRVFNFNPGICIIKICVAISAKFTYKNKIIVPS